MTAEIKDKAEEKSACSVALVETVTAGDYRAELRQWEQGARKSRVMTRFYAPGGVCVTLSEQQVVDLATLFGDCAHLFVSLEQESEIMR